MRRLIVGLMAACMGFGSATVGAQEEDYPSKPIRIIVGSAAGGYLDIITRAIAEELRKSWGQPVVVENRAGASGAIASAAIKNSEPDGYTWGAATEAHLVVSPRLQEQPLYDFEKDLVGVSALTRADQMVVAAKSLPVNTLQDLVSMAKDDPNSFFYGSWGIGSHPHLFYSQLEQMTGAHFRMVPYKGVAPTMQALRSGEVQYSVISAGTAGPLLEDGVVKVLASASRERTPLYPNVPTTGEQGYADLNSTIYMMFTMPKGTPQTIVDKASDAVQKIVKDPDFSDRWITRHGFQVVGSDSKGMHEILENLSRSVEQVLKAAGIKKTS